MGNPSIMGVSNVTTVAHTFSIFSVILGISQMSQETHKYAYQLHKENSNSYELDW